MKPIYILVLLLVTVPSWARQSCEELSSIASFWSAETLPSGFALGFDSEIPTGSALAFIRKDLKRAESASKLLGTLRINGADMARIAGMSEAQFRSFGLRPGTPLNRNYVTPDDWNSETWRRMLHGTYDSDQQLRFVGRPSLEYRATNRFYVNFDTATRFRFPSSFGLGLIGHLVPLMREGLPDLKLPLKVEADTPDIELTYDGYSTNPAEFKGVVDKVHLVFPQAQTHFHLGIATRLLPEDKAHTMLRGLEAAMILEAAAKAEYRQTDKNGFSTLVEFPGESRVPHVRGVLGIRFNRWWAPEDMHDLEIRQYLSRARALHFVEMAIHLALHQHRLRDFRVNFAGVRGDADHVTFNLHGALLYLGNVFVQSGRMHLIEIGRKLLMFASEIASLDGVIQDELRDRLSEFSLQEDFENLVTPDLFLEAEI